MNNKSNNLITIILAVAVVMLFILHFTRKSNASSVANDEKSNDTTLSVVNKPNLSGSLEGLKIGYVNSDTVTKYYDYNTQLSSEMMAKQVSAQNKLKKEDAKLQADWTKFQQEAPIMGQAELERKQMEFMERDQQIRQMEQDLAMSLQDKTYKASTEYMIATDKYMQKIGKSLGYDYIIGYNLGGFIMYANPEHDITQYVIEMLNKEYNTENKAE